MDCSENDNSGSWVLPAGAAFLVRQIAAEQIFMELTDGRLDGKEGVNHKEIHCLLYQFPGICQRTFDIQWDNGERRDLYPLAILCCLKAPLEVIQFAFYAYPEALTIHESRKGCNALHYACTFQAPHEVVSFLVAQFPRGPQIPRTDGMLPLHLACYFQSSCEVIDLLVGAWPEAVTTADSGRWSPLHAAASGKAELRVVEKLHQLSPDKILSVDDKGRTPLHLACWKKGNKDVVSFLLKQAPRTLLMADNGADTPLFRAARSQSIEVLREIIPENPPLDDLGATLLHYSALDNTADVVDYLATRFPDMLVTRTRDRDRYIPLHGACHFDAPLANIQTLVRHKPRTLAMQNGYGLVALEVAKRCRVSQDLVDYLDEASQKQKPLRGLMRKVTSTLLPA